MKIPRPDVLLEYAREALWVLPTVATVGAVALGVALVRVEPAFTVFDGGADGARQILSTVAGAVITVTATVFTLTIVALEIASSQYSPRLLRNFLADRGTQVALSVLVATFAYCLTLLRELPPDGPPLQLPQLALAAAFAWVAASIAALVYYVHHISQSIRVESIVADVERETLATIRRVYPDADRRGIAAEAAVPADAVDVPADESGYLQAIDLGALYRGAVADALVVRLRRPVGEHIVRGTTLAWAWPVDAGAADPDLARVSGLVNANVEVSFERTPRQDVAFGIRQLVDIAIRAISPAVNDPTTAVNAISHLAVVLAALARREIGPHQLCDTANRVRVAVPSQSFPDYLAEACDEIRRYGAREPTVLVALLRALTDVASLVSDPARLAAIHRQVGLVVDDARREVRQPADLEPVLAEARRVSAACAGRLPGHVSGVGP